MVGKLIESVDFWERELKASPFVISMIKHGYRLPFFRRVGPFYDKNNLSSLRHQEFVETAIEELLKQNCIEELECMPFCCNPLTVAERGDKLRLVIDLRKSRLSKIQVRRP